jgi:hypothetical protein
VSFQIEKELKQSNIAIKFPGDNGGGETPVPIPNTAVKPSCADGTAVYPWKSRTLPGINFSNRGKFFLFGATKQKELSPVCYYSLR